MARFTYRSYTISRFSIQATTLFPGDLGGSGASAMAHALRHFQTARRPLSDPRVSRIIPGDLGGSGASAMAHALRHFQTARRPLRDPRVSRIIPGDLGGSGASAMA